MSLHGAANGSESADHRDGSPPESGLPSVSSSRRSIGPSHACATPSKPTAGPGSSCWLTRSCVWRGRWWLTSDCPGTVLNQRASSRQRASSAGFRGSCHDCPFSPSRQNPADVLRVVPKASARVARCAIRPLPRPFSARRKSLRLLSGPYTPRQRLLLRFVARLLLVKSQD